MIILHSSAAESRWRRLLCSLYLAGMILTALRAAAASEHKAIAGTIIRTKFRIWISGQVGRTPALIRREMKRHAAIEPVIGHLKAEHPWTATI